MMSIGVIENDVTYRTGLEYMLRMLPEYRNIGCWENVESAAKQLIRLSPDVILIDIDSLSKGEITSINKLKRQHPTAFFIVLASSGSTENILEVLKAGGTSYLLKEDGIELILSGLRELPKGAVPMSKRVARKVIEHFHELPVNNSDFLLTRRESEILDRLAQGKAYKGIARELGITLTALKKHISNAYSKLKVQNRIEAINKWKS